MNNSTLISILKTFTKDEMKRLGEMAESPFFNKSKSVILLYTYLEKYYPEFPEKKIQKEKIFAKLFKDEPYNDERMRSYISGLLKLVNEFLIITGNEQNPNASSISLLKELSKRKLHKQVYKKAEEIKEGIAKSKNLNGLLDRFLLDYAMWLHLDANEIHKENLMEQFLEEYNPIDSLTSYFLYHYFALYIRLLIKKGDFNYQLDTGVSDKVYNLLKETTTKNEMLLKQKYFQFKVVKDNKMGDAKELKEMVEGLPEEMPEDEIIAANYALISAYNKMIMTGHPEYFRNIFETYRWLDKHNLLTYYGFIETITFKNIVSSACKLRELEFLEQFINKYEKYLQGKDRENEVKYSQARLHFLKKDYSKVLSYLSTVENMSFYQNLLHKIMLIQVFYERKDEPAFLSNLNSTKRFLENDTDIPESRKKMYTDFVSIIGGLFKEQGKLPAERHNIASIKKETEDNNYVVQKEWLLEKAEELKQPHSISR